MKQNRENIALFDMDNTLCDYDGAMRRDLIAIDGLSESLPIDFHKQAPNYIVKRMALIKNQPDWWLNLPELKIGMEIYKIAKEIGFDIHILTKGPKTKPNAWTEKVKWCHSHLGEDVKITITSDKSLVYGKVLVDDYPDYVLDWLKWRKRGTCIMPEHKYNENFRHPQVLKYNGNNMEDVKRTLNRAYNRVPGK